MSSDRPSLPSRQARPADRPPELHGIQRAPPSLRYPTACRLGPFRQGSVQTQKTRWPTQFAESAVHSRPGPRRTVCRAGTAAPRRLAPLSPACCSALLCGTVSASARSGQSIPNSHTVKLATTSRLVGKRPSERKGETWRGGLCCHQPGHLARSTLRCLILTICLALWALVGLVCCASLQGPRCSTRMPSGEWGLHMKVRRHEKMARNRCCLLCPASSALGYGCGHDFRSLPA